MNPGPSVLLLSPKFVGLAELLAEVTVATEELLLVLEAACSIEANFSCSNAEKAFLGNVLEAADVVVGVEEAMACSYSLCTRFNTFMAFTCLLSTYSGSEIGCCCCC